jgi:hypothetical protein
MHLRSNGKLLSDPDLGSSLVHCVLLRLLLGRERESGEMRGVDRGGLKVLALSAGMGVDSGSDR